MSEAWVLQNLPIFWKIFERFYIKLQIFMFFWCKITVNVFAFFRLYLKEEHKAKKDRELDETKWTVGNLKTTVNKTDIMTGN